MKQVIQVFGRALSLASIAVAIALYIPFKIANSTIATVATLIGTPIYYMFYGKDISMKIFTFCNDNVENLIVKHIVDPYFEVVAKLMHYN